MSNFTLDSETYAWLNSLKLLPPPAQNAKGFAFNVPSNIAPAFESGQMVARLVNMIAGKSVIQIDSLKYSLGPSAKLQNWNIISDGLKALDFDIDGDLKSLIVAGDYSSLAEMLNDLRSRFSPAENLVKSKIIKVSNKGDHIVDLSKFDPEKDFNDVESLLEFLILGLCHSLRLKPNHAAMLLTKNRKYLAFVLTKGVHNEFEPVINLYDSMKSNLGKLLELSKDEKTDEVLSILDSLRPGLFSKSEEVTLKAIDFFSTLGENISLEVAWKFLISNPGLLSSAILSVQRHPFIQLEILVMLKNWSRFNFSELLTKELRGAFTDKRDFFFFAKSMLKAMADPKFKEEIQGAGIVDDWLNEAVSENVCLDDQVLLSTESWIRFSERIESDEERVEQILGLIRRALRHRSRVVVISSLTCCFRLLEFLGERKSSYAPSVYRIISLALIDFHSDVSLREIIFMNMIVIYERFPNIPHSILMDPLLKHIQTTEGKTYILNTPDFVFLENIAMKSNISVKLSFQILDLLVKVYLNNIIFSSLAISLFTKIISKVFVSENEITMDFMIKVIKIALAIYYTTEKEAVFNDANLKKGKKDAEIQSAQKKLMVLDSLRQFIALKNDELNERLRSLLAHTQFQIKQTIKQVSKPLMNILALLGNPEKILANYEAELQAQRIAAKQKGSEIQQQKFEEKLKEKGLGIKLNKSTPKMQVTTVASLAAISDPRIMTNLKNVQDKYLSRVESEMLKAKEGGERYDKTKKNLRMSLERRSVEQGIGVYNQTDVHMKLLYPEGTREKDFTKEQKHGLTEIELFNEDYEEERDQVLIDLVLRRHNKALKYLFIKYANTGYSYNRVMHESFDSYKQVTELLSLTEAWKLLKDYKIITNTRHKNLTQEQVGALIRSVNMNLMSKKIELTELDFHGFELFLVQLSIMLFKELTHLPPSFALKTLLMAMRDGHVELGYQVDLFDDPELTAYIDSDVIKELNSKLRVDPECMLPDGFKKVQEKEVEWSYRLPENLDLEDNYTKVYSLVNDILNESLGFQLYEAFTDILTFKKAKPILFGTSVNKGNTTSTISNIHPLKIRKLPVPLKMAVANLPFHKRDLAFEVADVLNEVLNAVEKGKTEIKRIEKKPNDAQLEKQRKEEEELEYLRKLDESWKKHKQEYKEGKIKPTVGRDMSKKPLDPYKFSKDDPKPKKIDRELDMSRGMYTKVPDHYKLVNYFEMEDSPKKDTKPSGPVEDIIKRNMNTKQKESRIKNHSIERSDEEPKKKEKPYQPPTFNILDYLGDANATLATKTKFEDLIMRDDMKTYFAEKESIFKKLYDHLISQAYITLDVIDFPALPMKSIIGFSRDFNIIPGIVSQNQIVLMFKTLIRDKKRVDGEMEGLNYNEFLNFLCRIINKDFPFFVKLGTIVQQGNLEQGKELAEDKRDDEETENERKQEQGADMQELEKKEIGNIDLINRIHLDAMLFYLGLNVDPRDKNAIEGRFRETMEDEKKSLPNKMKIQSRKFD